MIRWRYTTTFRDETAQITRPSGYFLESEEEGLKGLEDFLGSCRQEFGDKCKSVSLEECEYTGDWNERAAVWQVVKELPV